MNSPMIVTLIATALVLPALGDEDAAGADRERIQGAWKVVALEAGGEHAPAEVVARLRLVFKGDNLTFKPGEPGFTNYTVKLDPSAKPPLFDMTHADGKSKGVTRKGIYSLKGDDLRICFGKAGQRPREFTADAKSGQAMYVLKREVE